MFNIDNLIKSFDSFIRTINNTKRNKLVYNDEGGLNLNKENVQYLLTDKDRIHSCGLMRVNHSGEVCAQALYRGQQINAVSNIVREFLLHAEEEEIMHLNWCNNRIKFLNSSTSLFNPLWYIGAFSLGIFISKLGDDISLAFVAETEKQVEEHLIKHLEKLPVQDLLSIDIVRQMINDEKQHANYANKLGASQLPLSIRYAMKAMSKIMTRTAYYI